MTSGKWDHLTSRQWNLMIRMVNEGDPREKAEQFFTKEEMELFDSMKTELAEMRKEHPGAAFSPVETDW